VELAAQSPDRHVVFLGVGFETTTPGVAACILTARDRGLKNYSVLCGHKTVPQALRALAADPEIRVGGLILPGHVSTVIGAEPYRFLVSEFHIPSVIVGFEPADIVQGVLMLARQIAEGAPRLEIQYRRSVQPAGNAKAVGFIERVFEPCDSVWRGIGNIPGSGLRIRPEFAEFDAEKRLDAAPEPEKSAAGCICGAVLRGVRKPSDCALFASACTPQTPVGACMVSSEGTCAAYYKYGREN
jgi:hydrogenase expression/formation protein HypD